MTNAKTKAMTRNNDQRQRDNDKDKETETKTKTRTNTNIATDAGTDVKTDLCAQASEQPLSLVEFAANGIICVLFLLHRLLLLLCGCHLRDVQQFASLGFSVRV